MEINLIIWSHQSKVSLCLLTVTYFYCEVYFPFEVWPSLRSKGLKSFVYCGNSRDFYVTSESALSLRQCKFWFDRDKHTKWDFLLRSLLNASFKVSVFDEKRIEPMTNGCWQEICQRFVFIWLENSRQKYTRQQRCLIMSQEK